MTVRIGIDTGGTFTDVVGDDPDGRVFTTKVPSTPSDPSVAFLRAIEKAQPRARSAEVVHGTTVATNALLEDDFSGLGFITTAGFRGLLEIGRQSVPDSYGNSYFWVKPERIVPLHLVQEVDERLDRSGAVIREFDEAGARAVARWFREQGIACVGVCFLHAYMNPDHERRMRDVLADEHPDCTVSLSSDVLSEYREYERSVTTLVDAFVKPRVAAYAALDPGRLDRPFYIMKSNGGVIAGTEVHRQADHDDPLRAGGGHARRRAGRGAGGLLARDHARRRRHVDRRGGDQRRPAEPDHRGLGRPLRRQGPDGRRHHGRHRRRVDRLGRRRRGR